jgi:hypothetical protein
MKRQLAIKGLLALIVSVVAILCFVLQPFGSVNAGPPTPTPTPGKTLLRLDIEAPEGNLSALEHDASLSRMESTCTSTSAQEIFYSIADAEVRQGYPTANYGSSVEMWCGYDDYLDPDGQIVRCLIKFDISSLPTGATINSAVLKVYLVGSWDYPGRTRTYTTYRISYNWSENTITWNNAPSYAEAYGSTGVTHGSGSWYSFDVANLVRAWHDGTYPNYGIMLRGPEWSGSDSSWKAFSTRESSADPYLVINYTPPPPPTLGASPTLLRFQAYGTGPNPEPQAVTISNITAGSLDWSAAKVGGASWLGLDKTSGTVTPSSPDTMNVSVSTSGLAYGTYTERIAIETAVLTCSNKTVDVVFDYYEAQAPEQWIFLPIVSKDWDGTSPGRGAVALVVGVAEYPYFVQSAGVRAGGDPSQLQFTDDDARAIRDVAIYKGNFRVEDVMTLLNTDGTRAAIENGFDWLDDRENENTLVLVSFSGHGGQAPDAPPYDEADGKDEFIAPSDTTLAGDNIILDDELDAWLSKLESKHIVVIIDSCNSGGMIDLAGVAAGRGIGFVLGTQGVIAQVAEADGLAADINREGRVVLVASRTDQESWEFGALQNGVFSYYFVEGLCSTIADGDGNGWISAEEAFSYLECRVDNYVYDHTGGVQGGPYHQNPQLYDGTWGGEWITQP